MIRRFALIFLLAVISMTLASSMDAGRRRSVGKGGTVVVPPPDKVVELVMPVLSYKDPEGSGEQVVRVMGESHFPLILDTVFTAYVQKPGGDVWQFLHSHKITPEFAGLIGLLYLYSGAGFYDELNGVRQYWTPGAATFKVVIQSPTGEITSVRTSVLVPAPDSRVPSLFPLGPVQKVVPSSDGKTALLVGSLPGKPTIYWFLETWPGVFHRYGAEMAPDHTIPVPKELAGSSAFLVSCFGYPDAECWTMLVDLPVASND